MGKDVLLTISGLQFQNQMEEEDMVPVEVITAGNYYQRNGRHYVLYDEVMEGISGVTKNTIKIQDEVVEVVKHGATNVHMRFEKDKKNVTCYNTPFGNMMIGMQASGMDVQVQEQQIKVNIDYILEINYEYVADCSIHMDIMSKQAQNLNIIEA